MGIGKSEEIEKEKRDVFRGISFIKSDNMEEVINKEECDVVWGISLIIASEVDDEINHLYKKIIISKTN